MNSTGTQLVAFMFSPDRRIFFLPASATVHFLKPILKRRRTKGNNEIGLNYSQTLNLRQKSFFLISLSLYPSLSFSLSLTSQRIERVSQVGYRKLFQFVRSHTHVLRHIGNKGRKSWKNRRVEALFCTLVVSPIPSVEQ